MSYNILIVDDSPVMRAIVKKTLTLSGIDLGEIHEAANGLEALEKIREAWIDIILTDINMPQMTGIELVEQMADDNVMASIPVIVVSTDRSEVRIDYLKQRGVRAYIQKPFRPESIRDVLLQILDGDGGTNE